MRSIVSRRFSLKSTVLGLGLLAAAPTLWAQEQVLNLYSARHYQTDEALYANFTKATGIKINRVDTDDAGLLARLKSEGSASPADVILLVDAARLWQAENEGLFLPVKSELLEQRIPVNLRAKAGAQGTAWFGFSTRARVIVYNKINVNKADVQNYQDLADPKNKGKVCTRSGSHPYNLSLFGALYEHLGAAQTEQWLKGVVGNMAREPKGGDTDQIKAVASGECGIALTNTYYLARMMRSNKPDDRAVVEKVGVVFPNQQSWGTHVNIAGGAVARHAKNRDNAVKFLEYLSSPEAQVYFANGNNEWPTVPGVKPSNPALEAMGNFKMETIPVSTVGANIGKVQQLLDKAGYK
ncbi:Fe(3+) ABC transporter substrate-binding protein [Pelomonas sp. CA6]|uniref:Fe(3+) ABC transporter substrate-binding protein n=1 Tax=Pelomonas sp. CA6 TaxID=2907999 RepID=UPI001F4BA801|nr:Fe(3+) ABC transporter substrate-binding protein [Pelomonas sp. CA6]MCH7342199.1 Fe(3+) ABC transporter substrate-binding protein [Pelomonas sp. CA6]